MIQVPASSLPPSCGKWKEWGGVIEDQKFMGAKDRGFGPIW